MTVLDIGWRCAPLPDDDEDHCMNCNGHGYLYRTISIYEHGCAFPHPDIEERPCPQCGGMGEAEPIPIIPPGTEIKDDDIF